MRHLPNQTIEVGLPVNPEVSALATHLIWALEDHPDIASVVNESQTAAAEELRTVLTSPASDFLVTQAVLHCLLHAESINERAHLTAYHELFKQAYNYLFSFINDSSIRIAPIHIELGLALFKQLIATKSFDERSFNALASNSGILTNQQCLEALLKIVDILVE